ncbi:hypothetical protein P4H82_27340 [Bacillus cereus]|nr:hypothetical protein [Bacillus cereus]MEB9190500.1 hypothetical protein [Bacillus cereus]
MKHVIRYSSIAFGALCLSAAWKISTGGTISDGHLITLLIGSAVAVNIAGVSLNTLREIGYFKK